MLLRCLQATLLAVLFAVPAYAQGEPGDLRLWYTAPAKDWMKEALPIGGGRLGGMIFGGVEKERVQFNEDSLWVGDEQDTGSYQAFGDLFVEMPHEDAGCYRRKLDLATAVHTINYASDGVAYQREYLASHPAGVLVLRFTADKKGAHSGTISLTDAHEGKITADGNRITSTGSLAGYSYSGGSNRGKENIQHDVVLDYEAQLLVLHEGGTLEAADGAIAFNDCDSLTLLLAAGTDFVNRREKGWRGKHPRARLKSQLEAAAAKPYTALRDEHVRDYQSLFELFALDLGKTPDATLRLPTDERIAAYKENPDDPDLEELLFQYARYMMIASSRPGSLPANLQGLWNMSNRPPWRSDYHADVNVQMNYWFVDAANLPGCFDPYAEWLHSIRGVRTDETRAHFNVRGWTMHGENGIFGGSTWKWVKPTAAWCAQNSWDHYAFTQDEEYLRTRCYPILKELCEFWEDMLKELPDGTLVSPEGYSPEHGPEGVDGVAHDQQLVWDLFSNYVDAAEALGVDEAYRTKIASMRERLLGPQIGRWGQLQEWMEDLDNPKDNHRHLSHLIAVHPGRQISPLSTPEWAEAARVSMNARGDASTGWSRAWKICIWARLHDGNRTYSILSGMLQNMILANLFNTHPPFQIDGNFGYAAGVCEMLVQSHMGEIHLLPALPDAWSDGSVQGMLVRGGHEMDLAWQSGELTKATLRSLHGTPCRIRSSTPVTVTSDGKPVETRRVGDSVIAFATEAGGEYVIRAM